MLLSSHAVGNLCLATNGFGKDEAIIRIAIRNFVAMARRGPYRALTLKEKLDAIGDIERGVKLTDVATKFGVSKSTLSTIVKAKSRLRQEAEDFTPSRKRLRKGNFPQLEKALLMWCHQAWASKIPISGPLLREQGLALALRMGLVDFTASDGWIDKFKKRHGLVFKTVSGESAGVNTDVTKSWQETRLQEILRDYQPADIYNADECGLVFKCLPNKTLWPRNRKCAGGKASKERLTVLVCTNMDGSHKLPLLVIGKSKKPRCFKGIRSLPVDYEANARAWMTQELFEKWLRRTDKELQKQNRKVLLVLDNCTAHGVVKDLQAITLEFLPGNTTSILQPLDQGIIKNLKVLYRARVLSRMLVCMENEKSYAVDVLCAVHMLAAAWSDVKATTIANCFAHAGFLKEQCLGESSDDSEVMQDIEDHDAVLSSLKEHGLDVDLAEYAAVDDDVVTCREATLDDIVREIRATESESDEEDVASALEKPPVTAPEALDAVDRLRRFLQSQQEANSHLLALNAIETLVFKSATRKVQTTLDKYLHAPSTL